jgi:hypothetical protein
MHHIVGRAIVSCIIMGLNRVLNSSPDHGHQLNTLFKSMMMQLAKDRPTMGTRSIHVYFHTCMVAELINMQRAYKMPCRCFASTPPTYRGGQIPHPRETNVTRCTSRVDGISTTSMRWWGKCKTTTRHFVSALTVGQPTTHTFCTRGLKP